MQTLQLVCPAVGTAIATSKQVESIALLIPQGACVGLLRSVIPTMWVVSAHYKTNCLRPVLLNFWSIIYRLMYIYLRPALVMVWYRLADAALV